MHRVIRGLAQVKDLEKVAGYGVQRVVKNAR